MFADEPAEHLLHPGDDGVQVDRLGREDLLAAEGEELPGKGRRPVQVLLSFDGVPPERVLGRGPLLDEIAVPHDDGQHVVEVVGDAAGEPPDGFDLCA